jgi:hypothetical protein
VDWQAHPTVQDQPRPDKQEQLVLQVLREVPMQDLQEIQEL